MITSHQGIIDWNNSDSHLYSAVLRCPRARARARVDSAIGGRWPMAAVAAATTTAAAAAAAARGVDGGAAAGRWRYFFFNKNIKLIKMDHY